MFRKLNQNEKPASLRLHFAWEKVTQLNHVALLSDERHLVAINSDKHTLQIWNIHSQECIWEMTILWNINAIVLLKCGNLVIADDLGNIYQLQIDTQNQQLKLIDTINTAKNKISSMTVLENGSLVTGHENGSINIWDLTSHKLLDSFIEGRSTITALDTRSDGSLLIGNAAGHIMIHDWMTSIKLINGNSAIKKLVALPDNSIVYADDNGYINSWNIKDVNPVPLKISETGALGLISMPNGLIGCSITNSLQFFETPYIKNYVMTDNEIKESMKDCLPITLSNIVSDYANLALFKHPKQPHKKENLLTAYTEFKCC